MTPRVLFVGRGAAPLPLSPGLAKKWDAVEQQLDYRHPWRCGGGAQRRRPLPALGAGATEAAGRSVSFTFCLPFRVGSSCANSGPEVVVAADPFVGAAVIAGRTLARSRVPVIVEVHGDWRTLHPLYGSPFRKLSRTVRRPHSRRVVLRRADATRALSEFTSGLVAEARGRPADASFATYTDLSAFTAKPLARLPERPTALFVGMLEAYKNVDGPRRRLAAGRRADARGAARRSSGTGRGTP